MSETTSVTSTARGLEADGGGSSSSRCCVSVLESIANRPLNVGRWPDKGRFARRRGVLNPVHGEREQRRVLGHAGGGGGFAPGAPTAVRTVPVASPAVGGRQACRAFSNHSLASPLFGVDRTRTSHLDGPKEKRCWKGGGSVWQGVELAARHDKVRCAVVRAQSSADNWNCASARVRIKPL